MEYCEKHTNIKLVPIWTKTRFGNRLEKLCPKCDNLITLNFQCSKCGWKNTIWIQKKQKPFSPKCERCLGTGIRGVPFISNRDIPSWRLNIDDSSPEEVLQSSPSNFGMRPLSKEEWNAYYENGYEKEKLRKFKKEKKQLIKETLGSPDFAEPEHIGT